MNSSSKQYSKDDLKQMGRRGVMQIVPPRNVMRPCLLHEDTRQLAANPLSSPTGPGGAPGFRNVAGSQIAVPEVTNVYLGKFWDDQNFLEGFSKAVVENGYLDPLKTLEYGTGPGTYRGSIDGPTLSPGDSFSDVDAQNSIQTLVDTGKITPNQNTLYMLLLPDGVTSTMSDGSKSCTDYCGYHDAFDYQGVSIAYAVLPASLCSGCGGLIGDFTAVYAHELAEAITDKVPGEGWVAADGEENGDLEAWVLMGWGPPANPNLYTVQGYYTIQQGNTVGAWRAAAVGGS